MSVLQRVKQTVLNPDCPECGTTMETRETGITSDQTEYECPECDATLALADDPPQGGRPTRL